MPLIPRSYKLNTTYKYFIMTMIFLIFSTFLPLTLPAQATRARYQSGYDFNDESNIKWDLGGNYELLDDTYGKIKRTDDRNGGKNAICSYTSLNPDMFKDCDELTVSMWVEFTKYSGMTSKKIFFAGDVADTTSPYISLDFSYTERTISVSIYDGIQNSITIADVQSYFQSSPDWMQIAFTYRNINGSNVLSLYINGAKASEVPTQVVLKNISPNNSYLTYFNLDDVYITNFGLDENKVSVLMNSAVKDFMTSEGASIPDTIPLPDTEDPGNEEIPIDEIPGDINTDPVIPIPGDVTPLKFNWLAYTFDKTFDLTRDLNNFTDSKINSLAVNSIDTESFGGLFANGLTRRKAVYPISYMSLASGLLYDADSFTFSAMVYREDLSSPTQNASINTNIDLNTLFEFTGVGKLTFSPFSTDAAGTDNAFVEAGASSTIPQKYTLRDGKLANVNGHWVHFAFTFDANGEVLVYTNGVLSETIDTDLRLSNLKLSSLKIITNSINTDSGRIIIDDIYMAPRALNASEIRKLNYYGVVRFVTEVLPDPKPDKSGDQVSTSEEVIDLRPDESDELEDKFLETANINGFIGTTFDVSGLIGKDYNNAVIAVIRNASLAQGDNKYGLALDGANSYLRYPLGILDTANEFSISLAYNWSGHFSGTRTQKLFDFSFKNNSIDTPKRYMTLSMGNGISGMEFTVSDGINTTTLKAENSVTNTWSRVSVTIKNGIIKLYINSDEIAKASTNVNISMIKPNFCYIGKSGVKGDPLFKGSVDEIYISTQELIPEQITAFEEGIAPVMNQTVEGDVINTQSGIWDDIIKGVLIATVVLVIVIIIVIVITIIRK